MLVNCEAHQVEGTLQGDLEDIVRLVHQRGLVGRVLLLLLPLGHNL